MARENADRYCPLHVLETLVPLRTSPACSRLLALSLATLRLGEMFAIARDAYAHAASLACRRERPAAQATICVVLFPCK